VAAISSGARGEWEIRPSAKRGRPLDRAVYRAYSRSVDPRREIAREATRHNLTDIGTLNNPLSAIAFLQAEYRSRFRFTELPTEVGPEIRAIQFEEQTRPTILKRGKNEDLLSSGRMWIEEETGRVVKTELVATLPPYTGKVAVIETDFAYDPDLKINVPREMRDWYAWKEFQGVARYQRFRRFQVQTEESFRK
jgi:hypothetical protein